MKTNLTIEKIRLDFPQLQTKVNNQPLVYFDNAATTLKPKVMIDKISHELALRTSNVHRGVHTLSEEGTRAFEETRNSIQQFLNATHSHEVIFTKGTTESINLIAYSAGEAFISAGDEILISEMEHHSNIVPWQILAERKNAILKVVPVTDSGEIDLKAYEQLLTKNTKIVSITHTSNTLGTINPLKLMIKQAHDKGAKFVVDAAQAIAHDEIDVQDLDCDFLVFSAHKLFGPNGLGILYGKEECLNLMPPYQSGGAMISEVSFTKTTYNILPTKFEAGTPAIAEVIAFKSSLDYVASIGFDYIRKQEHELLHYATAEMLKIDGLKIIGTAKNKTSVISFVIENCHPHDLGTLLDKQGVAIRTGHHCTQPLLKKYQLTACARASFSFYNTHEEIDQFIDALKKAKLFLQ